MLLASVLYFALIGGAGATENSIKYFKTCFFHTIAKASYSCI